MVIPQVDGTAVDVNDIPSLEVTVSAMELTLQPGMVVPEKGKVDWIPEITAGKPGGSR